MKSELERIWSEEPLAWPCNICKWSNVRPIKLYQAVKQIGKLFVRKGKCNRIRK